MGLVSMTIKPEVEEAPGLYDARPRLCLTDDQVEALGIKGIPAPGAVMTLHARVVVSHVSAEAEEPDEAGTEGNAPDVYLTLTVTDMELTPAAERTAASVLYGE